MKHLQHFLNLHRDLGAFISTGSDQMILLSGTDGEIYWANEAFQAWIGYTIHEFTRRNNPITWTQITIPDENLEADVMQARSCAKGEITNYRVRKDYLPKNQHAKMVELYVRRFPEVGDFVFFVVEVDVLFNGHERMARTYEKLSRNLLAATEKSNQTQKALVEAIEKSNSQSLNGVANWLKDHPVIGIPTVCVLAFLLFGERVLEIIQIFSG